MKQFTKILDRCVVKFRKPSSLTYHVEIKDTYGGLHNWTIIGCGTSLEQAIDDALFVYENRYDKVKMFGIEWKFEEIDALKR